MPKMQIIGVKDDLSVKAGNEPASVGRSIMAHLVQYGTTIRQQQVMSEDNAAHLMRA